MKDEKQVQLSDLLESTVAAGEQEIKEDEMDRLEAYREAGIMNNIEEPFLRLWMNYLQKVLIGIVQQVGYSNKWSVTYQYDRTGRGAAW